MALEYRLWARHHEGEEDLWCPRVFCDWCGGEVEAEKGNVYYYIDRPGTLYYNHKRCAMAHERALEKARPDEAIGSEELGRFLTHLLFNVEYNPDSSLASPGWRPGPVSGLKGAA